MILSRAFVLTNVSASDLVERERGRLPVRATWATKMRTASGSEVPSVLVTFVARLSNFGSTRQRKSTVTLQMCHSEISDRAGPAFCHDQVLGDDR